MQLTLKELQFLTQTQIRQSAVLEFKDAKIPKKWKDKKSAISWYEKARATKPTETKAAKKKTAKKDLTETVKAHKKVTAPKVKKEKKPANKAGQERRQRIVQTLSSGQYGAKDLAAFEGVQYKAILDDIHAIRHSRAGVDLLKGKVLADVRVGRAKIFFITTEKSAETKGKQIKDAAKAE